MKYVALLRGINVGGHTKVSMAKLKVTFEEVGLKNIKTYINSGNIIFEDGSQSETKLATKLETAIEKDFGFPVKVLVCSFKTIQAIHEALPTDWQNNTEMKCDVMFLWSEVDHKKILEEVIIKEGIDDVKYVTGALLWRVDRDKVTRSGIMRLVGTPLYKQMTIRNCNTVRKLYDLMQNQTASTT